MMGHNWFLSCLRPTQHSELKQVTGLDNGSLTHELFQEISMAVVRKINSKLLFVVPAPQVATKLHPKVHKQWITAVNHTSKS